jgi:tetratricopeptide (TPR) repeat protein
MIFRIASVVAVALAFSLPAARAESTTPPHAAPAEQQQWQKDQALSATVGTEVQANGILAVAPHLEALELALAGATQTMAHATSPDGAALVFTDGPAESLIAMAAVSAEKPGKTARAVDNPYPTISFFLGSYYDEIGKFDQALRALDAGLALTAVQGLGFAAGAHAPLLIAERGAALFGLKRWNDALAAFESGLQIADLDNRAKARMFRGKGFALTELGRLDDAEAAYNESLKLEPNNSRAENELRYIARLRTGSAPTAPTLYSVQPQSPPAQPPK